MQWSQGDRVTHRHNPELGPGPVVEIEGRTLVVEFPECEQVLHIAASADVLLALELKPGLRVRLRRCLQESRRLESESPCRYPCPADRIPSTHTKRSGTVEPEADSDPCCQESVRR